MAVRPEDVKRGVLVRVIDTRSAASYEGSFTKIGDIIPLCGDLNGNVAVILDPGWHQVINLKNIELVEQRREEVLYFSYIYTRD